MKKAFFWVMIFIVLLFVSCTVNDTTGLLVITNLSNSDVTNIRIGNTTLTSYLSSGSKLDYWYYTPLTGQLSATGAANKYDVTFKLNYEYKIEILEKNDKNLFSVGYGKEKGTDTNDQDNWDDPVD